MLKKILFVSFMLLSGSLVFAAPDVVDAKAAEMMQTIKSLRNDMYISLDLTPGQVLRIDELDSALYSDLEPEIKKIADMTQKLEDIANSENCTKDAVFAAKKDFKTVEKNMNFIYKRYSKEFRRVLTSGQKAKYRQARALKQAQLKQEVKRLRAEQKQQKL